MPVEITHHGAIIEAIHSSGLISELVETHNGRLKHELDVELIVYGRDYAGKKIGPYVRLFVYDAGEVVFHQGAWRNSFYIMVSGLLDVYVNNQQEVGRKVGEIESQNSFGEMVILTGRPSTATVVVSAEGEARILEVSRPALRLLRRFKRFGDRLDVSYRQSVLQRTLGELGQAAGYGSVNENLDLLKSASLMRRYGKQHLLIEEGAPIDRVMLIANGWLRRARRFGTPEYEAAADYGWNQHVDFLGEGHWLGLEGVPGEARWDYTATVMQPMEVMEISLAKVRADGRLRDALRQGVHRLGLAYDDVTLVSSSADQLALAAVEKEITTGVVDATNLLVMDMDLCVRCGNCSFACHKVHGQSRLMRRGIPIKRPISPGGTRQQNLVIPEVCIHCQDPACLTGCPTGAIARFAEGQVVIDPKTCIGCGDCATQCPYHAITLVERKAAAPLPRSFVKRLRALFYLGPPALPPSVTAVNDLVAIACNLCENTPLNPKGATSHAYSCQENCPTGAIVRVNPREYFTEAKDRISVVYRDQTHAIGRGIHRRDIPARIVRTVGVLAVVAIASVVVLAIHRYGLDSHLTGTWLTMRWLTGLGGLVSLAVAFTYAARKRIYKRRAGPLRYWMQVHVYAGISAGVILLLHAGNSNGGMLTSLLTVSLYLTLVSGMFGSVCYLFCPRLLNDLEGEPLLIEDLHMRRQELRETLASIVTSDHDLHHLVKNKMRKRFISVRYLLRQYVRREELPAMLDKAREEFRKDAEGLKDPKARRSLMEAVEATATLRRVDALIYLHQLLKLWVIPHVWTAVLTMALMTVHIAQVFYAATSR